MAALCAQPSAWQHGYAIARDTGLKSGTLYPILIRLADRGLMEARWEEEQPAGPLRFAAAAAGAAWRAWSGPAGDSAIVINRVDVISMAVILAGLPWAIRRAHGPVADGRLARLVRTGGYAAVLALVLVKTAVERVADAPPNNLRGSAAAWIGEVAFLAVMVGYTAGILAFTARRSPAGPAPPAPARPPPPPPRGPAPPPGPPRVP